MSALTPALTRLVEDLGSPDPAVRDDGGFASLAQLAGEGALDEHLLELGDLGVARLQHDPVHVRSFAALLLVLLVDRDNATGRAGDAALRAWLDAAVTWYAGEPDTRGWDPALGWLHAVAHGADLVGELAASPRLGRDDLSRLLDLLVTRAVTSTDQHWVQDEDDRVALAMMAVLRRDLLSDADVTAAVERLADAWRTVGPGPVPAQVDNAVRLARTLHLQLSLGVRPQPEADVSHPVVRNPILRTLGAALAEMHWFYGRPS